MDIHEILDRIAPESEAVDLFDLLTPAEKEENRIIAEITSHIIMRRKELGISQKELAEKLSISQPMVSQWESGDYNFTISSLAKLFDALQLRISLSFDELNQAQVKFINDFVYDVDTVQFSEAA